MKQSSSSGSYRCCSSRRAPVKPHSGSRHSCRLDVAALGPSFVVLARPTHATRPGRARPLRRRGDGPGARARLAPRGCSRPSVFAACGRLLCGRQVRAPPSQDAARAARRWGSRTTTRARACLRALRNPPDKGGIPPDKDKRSLVHEHESGRAQTDGSGSDHESSTEATGSRCAQTTVN